MIPRRFFWFFDLSILIVAFFLASVAVPGLQKLVAEGGLLHPSWIAIFSPVQPPEHYPGLHEYLWVLISMLPTTLIMMEVLGAYDPIAKQSLLRIWANSILAELAGLGLLSSTFFVLRVHGYSRLFVFSFVAFAVAGLSAYRAASLIHYRRSLKSGRFAKQVALIGSRQNLKSLSPHLAPFIQRKEYRVIGYFSEETGTQPAMQIAGQDLSYLGHASELGEVLIHQEIEYVIAVLGTGGADWLDQVVEHCDYFRTSVHIVPNALIGKELQDLEFLHAHEHFRLPAITLAPQDFGTEAIFLKRVVDVVISAIGLIVLSPLFLIVAILIKLTTPNLPVFYHWHVVGYRGKRFAGYKFTTMVADADERKKDLAAQNEMSGPVFKIKHDPRITPLGRFLRKFSINELPQLWSVLVGDMSLVGPRPAGPHELVRYEMWHKRKLSVRPGITCLWQIQGRNAISSFDDWVRLDLQYIATRSLLLDFSILARTVWVVFKGTGC